MKNSNSGSLSLRLNKFLLKLVASSARLHWHMEALLQVKIYTKEFDYRDDDIYVSSFMKSGTTVMQMMVYQLMTDGNMDFKHIYDVSPWLEQAVDQNRSLRKLPSPRIMKTHADYKFFPKQAKGKIIYVVRNGMDVAVSMYHQYRDLELMNMDWDKFLNTVFKRKSWFTHVEEWLENKKGLDIFYVKYEDLTQNPRKTIDALSQYLGIQPSEETIQRTIERCSFQFMKENEAKFGPRKPVEDKRRYDQFIRKGESNKGQLQFNDAQREWYTSLYNKHLGKFKLGYGNSKKAVRAVEAVEQEA